MSVLRNIVKGVSAFRVGSVGVKCERCLRGNTATHLITNAVIHQRVCAECAREARIRGMKVKRAHAARRAA